RTWGVSSRLVEAAGLVLAGRDAEAGRSKDAQRRRARGQRDVERRVPGAQGRADRGQLSERPVIADFRLGVRVHSVHLLSPIPCGLVPPSIGACRYMERLPGHPAQELGVSPTDATDTGWMSPGSAVGFVDVAVVQATTLVSGDF